MLQKKKMTMDKLARMTQDEFLAVRSEMNEGFLAIRREMASKDDLKQFATKDDLQKSTITVLQAIDSVIMRFDKVEKDSAADKLLHDRHETALENQH